jgi:uncharacterized protein YcbX
LKRQVLQISFKDKKDFVEVSFYQTQTEKEDDDKSIDMNICMSVCKGNNVGDAKVSTWLSEKLGRSCLLMRVSQLHQRDSQANLTKHQIRQLVKEDDSKFSMAAGEAATSAAAKIGFANQAQYLLISSASIDHLNMILQELHCHEGVSEEVFRANFIVEGCQAFEEDTWQSITIGGHVFEVSGPCSRCSMININQKTGTFNREPLQALSTYRRERANIYFGQFLTAKQPTSTQWLQVDDPIRIEQLKYSNI